VGWAGKRNPGKRREDGKEIRKSRVVGGGGTKGERLTNNA